MKETHPENQGIPGAKPLATLCAAPMEPGIFLQLALAICGALRELHSHDLNHNNLNPHTILVTTDPVSATLTGLTNDWSLPYLAAGVRREKFDPAYISPEQTGRLNLALDKRSDLYSLGVVFYRMLTGTLPFQADDLLGWVHSHIAREPRPPTEVVPQIPPPLSEMVLKLLAKNPADRYQSAAGLCSDLQRSLLQWESKGEISPFLLAADDLAETLLIPQKVYGREEERSTLMEAFQRVVRTGVSEIIMVAGYAGIGKTSLVLELSEPIAAANAWFAKGKFDRLQGRIPYRTVSEAFGRVVRQILAGSEAEISRWGDLLGSSLGNKGVMLSIIPQLELVIGPQPPPPQLSPVEERNRLHFAFREFIALLVSKGHPLVIFLDDLQWGDPASLMLMESLFSDPVPGHLLFIGAYRDDELGAGHPLPPSLERLEKLGRSISRLKLAPLSTREVGELLADALHADSRAILTLAQLVEEKTGNNPFFVIQFLLELYREGLISPDRDSRSWRWELAAIAGRGYTENVVELMVGKLRKLSEATLEVVTIAACFGNRIDLGTLGIITELPTEAVRSRMEEAVREGIVQALDDQYQFRHDRIQEAACSMYPEERRPSLHLRIGRLLLARLDEEQLRQRLFEVVDQLNLGAELIDDHQERISLARLNHRAGTKAKASVAYAAALRYLGRAIRLLPPGPWNSCYQEAFEATIECAEAAYLLGEYRRAEELFGELGRRGVSDLDRVRVLLLQGKLLQATGDFTGALQILLQALELVGIRLPDPKEALGAPLEEELARIREGSRRLSPREALEAEPSDPRQALIVTLLIEMIRPAYATCPPYYSLCSAMAVNRCLRYGPSADCHVAYSTFAVMLITLFGDIAAAMDFSEAAVASVERLGDRRVKGLVLASHGGLILPWRRHMAVALPILEEGMSLLVEAGDFLDAAYLSAPALWAVLEKGAPIEEVWRASLHYLFLNREMHNETGYQTIRVIQQLLASLKGETREPGSFDDQGFSEECCYAAFEEASWEAGIAYFEVCKLISCYLFGRYGEAVLAAERAEPHLRLLLAMPVSSSLCFYRALALLALYPSLPKEQQPESRRTVEGLLGKLKHWAEESPENFQSRYLLVSAQLAALDGEVLEAEELYERAIDTALANGFILNAALSLELAASFYRGRGFDRFSSGYLSRARTLYAEFGAEGKVRQLERDHPWLAEKERGGEASLQAGGIDAVAVAKATQAISRQVELDRLQETLMRIVIEQAGAERGVLLLARGEELFPEIVVLLEQGAIRSSRVAADAVDVAPQSVIDYVKRTRERVILDDARRPNLFSSDPYLASRSTISLLCLPVLRQSRLAGLLYLENNQLPGAFTPDRVAVLEMLAGQAAISLANARLYREMQQEIRERKDAEQRFRELVESAPDAIVMVGSGGEILMVNSQVEKLFGYRREELLGKMVEMLVPLRFRESHLQHRAEYGAKPQLRPMGAGLELFGRRKDDSEFPVSISLSPLKTDEGTVVIAAVRDITDLKRTETELRESEQRYRQLSESLEQRIRQAVGELDQKNRLLLIQSRQAVMGEMISNIAHQWRQPLNTLGLLAQELQIGYRRGGVTPEKVEETVRRILEIIRHMSRTIDDFRLFVHPERETEPFRGAEVLEKTLSLLDATLSAHHIKVTVDTVGDPVINGHPNEFAQVLLNLLTNARDAFVAAQSADPLIAIRLFREEGKTVVTVTDNAGGIPDGVIDKIFEPYFTTKGPEQGTGIGLYMCKTIIEKNMNGSISVRNVEGGAQFRIEI